MMGVFSGNLYWYHGANMLPSLVTIHDFRVTPAVSGKLRAKGMYKILQYSLYIHIIHTYIIYVYNSVT